MLRPITYLMLVCLIVPVIGCVASTGNVITPEKADAIMEAEVPKGKTLIYIFRKPNFTASAMPAQLKINGIDVATVTNGTFLYGIVDPGRNKIVIGKREFVGSGEEYSEYSFSIQSKPDQKYYYDLVQHLSGVSFSRIDIDQAISSVKACKFITDFDLSTDEAMAAIKRETPIAVQAVPMPAIPDDTLYRALDFGTYHALVIGNNDYREIKKLHTAVSDAQAINALLQDKYGFKTRLLLNATRADILKAINDYRRRLGPRDNLLIYYAGHGWLDKDADQGYWLPVDATEQDPTNWISNGSITDSLRAMEAKHVLVIADSCYSGKLSRGINVRVKTKNYYKKISAKKARTVMASGGLEPVADEGGKGTHSVFASALIEALNENQGVIDTTLLFSQIRRPVMVNTDQTPEYSDIRKAGHDGGDFLFVRRK